MLSSWTRSRVRTRPPIAGPSTLYRSVFALGVAALLGCAAVPAEPAGGLERGDRPAGPVTEPGVASGAMETIPRMVECDPELAPVTTTVFGRMKVRLPTGASVEMLGDGEQARVTPVRLSPEGCAQRFPEGRIEFVRLGKWQGVSEDPELLRDVLISRLGYEGRSSIVEQTIEGVPESFRLEAVVDVHAAAGRPESRRGLLVMRAFEGDVYWLILETPSEHWAALEATLQAVASSLQLL